MIDDIQKTYELSPGQYHFVNGYKVTRVPGGWIYANDYSIAFVPFCDDLKKTAKGFTGPDA